MRAKTRQTRQRTLTRGFGFHVLFAVLGVALGYSVLCLLGPRYDFLHVVYSPAAISASASADRSTSGSSTSEPLPGRQPAPRLTGDGVASPAPLPKSSTAEEPTAEPRRSKSPSLVRSTDRSAAALDDDDDVKAARSDSLPLSLPDNRSLLTDPTTPTRSDSSPGGAAATPFARFSSEIVLPTLIEAELTLGEIPPDVAADLEIEILQPDRRRRLARTFFCPGSPQDSRWQIYFANESEREQIVAVVGNSAPRELPVAPIAEVRLSNEQLTFRWLDDAGQAPWQWLRNSLLVLRAEGEQHVCQLRHVERRPPLTILRRIHDDELQVSFENLPPRSQLLLEVIQLDGFPLLTRFEGDPTRIPAGKTVYWKFDDAEYAGVAVTWRLAKDRVNIAATVGVKFQSTGDQLHVLSTQVLPEQQASVHRILADARREEQIRLRQQPLLERKIRLARQIQSQSIRNAEVKRRTLEKNMNDARLAAVRQQQGWAESDLRRFPTLERLASQIEGRGTIGVRLFAEASGHKIVFLDTTTAADANRFPDTLP